MTAVERAELQAAVERVRVCAELMGEGQYNPPRVADLRTLIAAAEAGANTENAHAHHGEPMLTKRDLSIAQSVVGWIRAVRETGHNEGWLPDGADFIKSRLFWRVRSGKKPLLHAPPTCFSCPWYEVVEEAGPHSTFDGGIFEWEPGKRLLSIAQCGYTIVEESADGREFLVEFNTYRFRVWRAPSTFNPEREDWVIQRDNFYDAAIGERP